MLALRILMIVGVFCCSCSAFMADGIPVETDPKKLEQIGKEYAALQKNWQRKRAWEESRGNTQRVCELDNAHVLAVLVLCGRVEGPYCYEWRQHQIDDCSQGPPDQNPFSR